MIGSPAKFTLEIERIAELKAVLDAARDVTRCIDPDRIVGPGRGVLLLLAQALADFDAAVKV